MSGVSLPRLLMYFDAPNRQDVTSGLIDRRYVFSACHCGQLKKPVVVPIVMVCDERLGLGGKAISCQVDCCRRLLVLVGASSSAARDFLAKQFELTLVSAG